jgi:hypothetical protein
MKRHFYTISIGNPVDGKKLGSMIDFHKIFQYNLGIKMGSIGLIDM